MPSLATMLSYLGLIGALGAATAAFLQAKKAHQANAGELFLSFSERYNSPDMAEAMRALVRFYFDTGENFAETWETRRKAGDKDALELNSKRRLVSRFYYDIARLSEVGLISDRFARALLANNGLLVFYRICEPMNDARHPDRERSLSARLRCLRETYGANRLHGPGDQTLYQP